ncbi:Proteolipid protein 2 [Sorochytrium milnesiophthora]
MEDTEWNDALRAQGILPPKEITITEDELVDLIEATVAEKTATSKPLEQASLDELDELEDEEDDRVLEMYRRKRMEELRHIAATERFGELYHISEPDFVREVSDASKSCWVVCHLQRDRYNAPRLTEEAAGSMLTSSGSIPACKLFNAHLAVLAARHKATKFVKIQGDHCIHGYPDRNMPTLLIYGEGDMKRQIVGISSFPGGERCTVRDLEKLLAQVGAIELPETDKPSERHYSMFSTEKGDAEDSEDDEYE